MEQLPPPTAGVAPLGSRLPPFWQGGKQWSGSVHQLGHKSSSQAQEKCEEKKIDPINLAEPAQVELAP